MMLKYRCRILFTTRSRYENHISLEVGELNPDTLLELVGKFFLEAERKQDEIKEIIDLLHGHTFAVELAADIPPGICASRVVRPGDALECLCKDRKGCRKYRACCCGGYGNPATEYADLPVSNSAHKS